MNNGYTIYREKKKFSYKNHCVIYFMMISKINSNILVFDEMNFEMIFAITVF